MVDSLKAFCLCVLAKMSRFQVRCLRVRSCLKLLEFDGDFSSFHHNLLSSVFLVAFDLRENRETIINLNVICHHLMQSLFS